MLAALLGSWGIPQGQCVLLIVEELTQNLVLASRNLPGIMLTRADRLVLSQILKADRLVIEAEALAYIQVIMTQTQLGIKLLINLAPGIAQCDLVQAITPAEGVGGMLAGAL